MGEFCEKEACGAENLEDFCVKNNTLSIVKDKSFHEMLPKERHWIEESQEYAYLLSPDLWEMLKKRRYYKALKIWPDKTPVDPGYLLFNIKYFITKSGKFYRKICSIIGESDILQQLKCYKSSNGYIEVTISTQGGTSDKISVRLHEIVGLMFLANPKISDEIHHNNAIRDDNHFWNLFWVSHEENLAHAGISFYVRR